MGIFENIKKLISEPKPKRRVLCPYCMGEIDTDYDHLEFACSKHPDEKIEKLKVNGHNITSCKKCQQEYMTTKARPADSIRCNAPVPEGAEKCDRILPSILLDPEYTVYRIALVGTTSSGKTCFKSRLKSEIDRIFPSGYFKYPSVDIQLLEVGSELPQSTYETETPLFEKPDFIGFRIKKTDKDGKTKERKILLIIYDFAGEEVSGYHNNQNSVIAIKYQNIMLKSDAIFFLIDPEQNFVNHLGNLNWNPDWELGGYHCDMSNVIRDVLTDINTVVAQQQRINPNNEEIRTPKLAYIFTKADKEYVFKALKAENDNYLQDNPNAETELLWDKEGNPIYTDYSKAVIPNPEKILQAFINENDIRYNFLFNIPPFVNKKDVRYFVCSSLGFDSTIEEKNHYPILCKIGPAFRVLDPLCWLLYDEK